MHIHIKARRRSESDLSLHSHYESSNVLLTPQWSFLETSLPSFIDKEYLTYKICSRHFTPCQFTWYVKVGNSGFVKCLKSGALPSLHLNVCCSDSKKPQLVGHKAPTKESATQTATEALTTQKATKESATQTEGNWVVSSFLHLTCHDIHSCRTRTIT